MFRAPSRHDRWSRRLGFVFPVVLLLTAASLAGVGVWSFLERRDFVSGEEKHGDLDRHLTKEARKYLIYSENPTFLAMAAGGFGMVVSIVGFLGVIGKRCWLIVLCISCIVLFFMASLATGFMALVYRKTLEMDTLDFVKQEVREQVNAAIQSEGVELSDQVSDTQRRFRCCGVDGFTDWGKNSQFSCNDTGSSHCSFPQSCCVDTKSNCSEIIVKDGTETEREIFTQGCVKSPELEIMVENAMDNDLFILSIYGFAVASINMIVLVLAASHLHYLETL
jgi:hypothetical protein